MTIRMPLALLLANVYSIAFFGPGTNPLVDSLSSGASSRESSPMHQGNNSMVDETPSQVAKHTVVTTFYSRER